MAQKVDLNGCDKQIIVGNLIISMRFYDIHTWHVDAVLRSGSDWIKVASLGVTTMGADRSSSAYCRDQDPAMTVSL